MADFTGTGGNDDIDGTTGTDDFFMQQGGNDRVNGGGAGDVFWFGAAFTAGDRIIGGDGTDILILEGDYSSGSPAVFGAKTIKGIENIQVVGAFNYSLIFVDKNIAPGGTLTVTAGLEDFALTLDGSAETNGSFIVFGGESHDSIETGNGDDVVDGFQGQDLIAVNHGTDTVNGGDDDDTVFFVGTGTFDASDRIDGGAGALNRVVIQGDYSGGVVLEANTLLNIAQVQLGGTTDYNLDFRASDIDATERVLINAANLLSTDSLTFTAKGSAGDGFSIVGGAGKDRITGSAANDTITGGLGADRLDGDGGQNLFVYNAIADSKGARFDTIAHFDTSDEVLQVLTDVTAIGADASGTLSKNTFVDDLSAALGAGALAAFNAVAFRADSGSLDGELFLVVDQNGVAGYQENGDLVVRLQDPDTFNLTTGNFRDA